MINPRTELLLQRARVAGATFTGAAASMPPATSETLQSSVVYLATAEGEFAAVFPNPAAGAAFGVELANEGRAVELAEADGTVRIVLPTNTQAERDAFVLKERQAAAAQGDMATGGKVAEGLAGAPDAPEATQPRTSDTADVADAIRVGVTGFAPGMSFDEVRAAHGMGPRGEDHTPAQLLTAFAFAHGAVAVHAPDPSGRPIDPSAPEGTLRVSWMLEPVNAKGEHDSMAADFLDVPCAVKFIRALADHENVGWNSAMLCCDRQHEDAVSAAMEEAYGVKPEKAPQPDPKELFGEDFETIAEHIATSLGNAIRAERRHQRKARVLKWVDRVWPWTLLACILPFVRFAAAPMWVAVVLLVALIVGTVRMTLKGERWWALFGAVIATATALTILGKLF
ncbi:hypothetical protein TMCBR2_gp032c [Caulobacter phage TMCBR2]|uniref:Uncharacterized protein n=1 Tax=Caulobacter phage TMCBR2 TaxID=3025404 RepID=A0AAE9YCT6_9CAUD|nr:hypothetical protein TMCBR2_gp032c [Caulobacter phage TMCBR2]WDS38280.1 hypothetical protein TMCBR3_gp032c [Caulobacter phage TMCBR3]